MTYSKKLIAILFLVALCNYQIFSIPFLGDEVQGLLQNRVIRDLHEFWLKMCTFQGMLQRPLSVLSYAINFQISQEDPWSYHALNLGIHLATIVLVYNIAKVLQIPALRAALIFGVHPFSTSCVAQIYGRNYSLGTMWMCMAIFLLLKGQREEKDPTRILSMQVLLWCLMLSSKQVFVFYPFLAALLLYSRRDCTASQLRISPRLLFTTIAFSSALAITVAYTHTIRYLSDAPVSPGVYFISQLAQAPSLLLFSYLIPIQFSLFHEPKWYHSIFDDPAPALGGILVLCAILLAVRHARHLLGILAFAFLLTILPTNSIVPKSETLMEWRMYPSLVFFSLFLATLYRTIRDSNRLFLLKTFAGYLALLLAISIGIVLRQNHVYQSPETSYLQVLQQSPTSAVAFNGLGYFYLSQERYDLAEPYLLQSHALKPHYRRPIANLYLLYLKTDRQDLATQMRNLLR